MPGRPLYTDTDERRRNSIPKVNALGDQEPSRSEYQRDCDRLIHASCFRRLQGKTQVFGTTETDFFRNRLTHSMEVAQIAKAIVRRVNFNCEYFAANPIDLDIVEFAALAHDLGHPPFGHNGELVLDELMKDVGGFEGNAQTLRIVSRLAKKLEHDDTARRRAFPVDAAGEQYGLNPTARCLASVLKYDSPIPRSRGKSAPVSKGYYGEEEDAVRFVKQNVCGDSATTNFKTVECRIMDCADDIAFSTHDLEDAIKGGFVKPIDLFAESLKFFDRLAEKTNESLGTDLSGRAVRRDLMQFFEASLLPDEMKIDRRRRTWKLELAADIYGTSQMQAQDGYRRGSLTAGLISHFLGEIDVKPRDCAPLSEIGLKEGAQVLVELLKQFVFLRLTSAPELRLDRFRAAKIIRDIVDALESRGDELLPQDYQALLRWAS